MWAYRMIVKKSHKQTPFQLVYVRESIVLASTTFNVSSIFISQATRMTDDASLQKRLEELMELDESRFLAELHQ